MLDDTLGALEIGAFLSFLLFGALWLQTYVYYRSFPSDLLHCKLLVGLVWVLDCTHTVVYAWGVYDASVSHFGQQVEVSSLTSRAWAYEVLLGGFITFAVQVFFALRLYHLIKRPWLAWVCWVLSIVCLMGSIAVFVLCNTDVGITQFAEKWGWLIAVTLALIAITDVIIAAAMCWYLWTVRKDGIESTAKLADRLIIWTLSTGLMTSLVAVLTLICVFVMTDNYIFLGVDAVLYKVYSNSLLASFNSRLLYQIKTSSEQDDAYFTTLNARTWPVWHIESADSTLGP